MKNKIADIIKSFVYDYELNENVSTKWGYPLVGFADVNHPDINNLKNTISDKHMLPKDVLEDASIIIAYFIPFTRELADTNRISKDIASPEWALAYEETNVLLSKINDHLIKSLTEMGYKADISRESTTFNRDKLISNWSHRHFARVAGLGTFGVNNMLITKAGGCGRYSTVVTNLDVKPDNPVEEEYCLYKKNGKCGVCVKNCPSGALSFDNFDRYKCYEVCKQNANIYNQFGNSYGDPKDASTQATGSQVCGKCVVGAPCTIRK